jgi:hypothetical protein
MAPVATLLTPLTQADIKENQERIERLPDETI